MSLVDKLTNLMSSARQEYDLSHKIGIDELTNLISPNPNLAKGTDDYSGDSWGTYAVQNSDENFNGLMVKGLFGGAHIGPIITINVGTYTYSFFAKAVDKTGNFNAKLRAVDSNTKKEILGNEKWALGHLDDNKWHRVSFTFSDVPAGSYAFIAENWPGPVLVAGQKVEIGSYATPYYTVSNRLITAPEVGEDK